MSFEEAEHTAVTLLHFFHLQVLQEVVEFSLRLSDQVGGIAPVSQMALLEGKFHIIRKSIYVVLAL